MGMLSNLTKVIQLKRKARSVWLLTYEKQLRRTEAYDIKGVCAARAARALHACCGPLRLHVLIILRQAEEAAPAGDTALLRYCTL